MERTYKNARAAGARMLAKSGRTRLLQGIQETFSDRVGSAPRFPAAHKPGCQQAQSEQSHKRQIGRGLGQIALIGCVCVTAASRSSARAGLIIGRCSVLIVAGRTRCAGRIRSAAARG